MQKRKCCSEWQPNRPALALTRLHKQAVQPSRLEDVAGGKVSLVLPVLAQHRLHRHTKHRRRAKRPNLPSTSDIRRLHLRTASRRPHQHTDEVSPRVSEVSRARARIPRAKCTKSRQMTNNPKAGKKAKIDGTTVSTHGVAWNLTWTTISSTSTATQKQRVRANRCPSTTLTPSQDKHACLYAKYFRIGRKGTTTAEATTRKNEQ